MSLKNSCLQAMAWIKHPNQPVESIKKNKPSKTKHFTPLNQVPQLLLGPQAPSDLVVVMGAVSCSSSPELRAREGFGSIICHLQAYKRKHTLE